MGPNTPLYPILSMFDEKKPPKTWPICDIVTGTMKSGLGHLLLPVGTVVLHAMLWNKTNLVEKNIMLCFVYKIKKLG